MNTLLLFISIIYSVTTPQHLAEKGTGQATSDEAVSVIAMYMYADWCGACQAIKPKMEKAKLEFEEQPVLFVKMNMTNKFTAHQSKLLATQLGLSEIFKKKQGMTGFVLLINADTNEVINKITTDDDVTDIVKKVTDAMS